MKKTSKIIIAVVAALCVIMALILIFGDKSTKDIPKTQSEELSNGEDIELKELSAYSGPYFEDGSDEEVSAVMQAIVTNNSTSDIQFAYLRVTDKAGNEYVFKITCLLRGETMAVLEENRAEYKSADSIESVKVENVVPFDSVPSMHSDIFTLMINGNSVYVINDDTVGHNNICVCYKNYDGETAIGGITYRISIPHLEAGETAEVNTAHLKDTMSKFLFITYD